MTVLSWFSPIVPYTSRMRDASSRSATLEGVDTWRELFRCDDLKLARAVATTVAAMEFDVRLCSIHPAVGGIDADEPDANHREDDIPGPHVIEVPARHFGQLAAVLGEIIDEQREFDATIEWRRDRRRARIVVILTITTAAEVALIWKLLEG